MAFLYNGILGSISGKVGTVVGSTVNGKNIVRAKPRLKRNPKSTPEQDLIKAKFKLTLKFLESMQSLLAMSIKGKKGINGLRTSFDDLFTNAITGTYPDLAIDYSKVPVAMGDLPGGKAPKAELTDAGVLFTWGSTTTKGAKASDKAIPVVYSPKYNFTDYTMTALRSDGTATLTIDGEPGEEFHTWLAFISADGKGIAHSRYLGKLTLS